MQIHETKDVSHSVADNTATEIPSPPKTPSSNIAKITPFLTENMLPSTKGSFLREVHRPLTAKLSYTLSALGAELGLSTVNAAAHVFSGCHLVNGMRIFASHLTRNHKSLPIMDKKHDYWKYRSCV